eukprot:gene467-1110_t
MATRKSSITSVKNPKVKAESSSRDSKMVASNNVPLKKWKANALKKPVSVKGDGLPGIKQSTGKTQNAVKTKSAAQKKQQQTTLPALAASQSKGNADNTSATPAGTQRRVSLPSLQEQNSVTAQPSQAEPSEDAAEGKKTGNDAKEAQNNNDKDNDSDYEQMMANQDSNKFENTARAIMFAKFLEGDLNAKYLKATLDDPDLNDKYDRIATPDLETDEEKEEAILNDFVEKLRAMITSPVSEPRELNESSSVDSEDDGDDDDDDGILGLGDSDSEQSSINTDDVSYT